MTKIVTQISLVLAFLLVQTTYAQAPICGQGNFYQGGNIGCIWYHPISDPAISLGGYFILPTNANGLAIGPNYNAGPNPTYWTTVSGLYYYYNGSTFINTGHSSGGTAFVNPGASANFIYNIDNGGQVSKYNGTGNATVIATYTDVVVQDIAGDANDNYYIIKASTPQQVRIYNSTASLLASYAANNVPGACNGMAITSGTIALLNLGMQGYYGYLSNNVIEFSLSNAVIPCSIQHDFASCPSESYIAPVIRAVPNASLPCNGGTITLTSDDLTNSQTYNWSGPGIVGAINSQSIIVNATGVYTRTMVTVGGITDIRTFTVYQGNVLPLQAVASSTLKCDYDAPVTLTVSGLANYTWSPSTSLSSSSGSVVSASPITTTNYTVSGSANGCVGSTVVSIAAAPLVNPIIVTPADTICIGSTALLAGNAGTTGVQWLPGNLTGSFVIVSPTVSTTYSLVVTNTLGCSKTGTAAIVVATFPNFTAAASQTQICEGSNVNLNMTGASSYTVLPGNLNGASVSLNPLAATLYTIVGANWNCSTTQQVFIDVMPLPQFSVSSSVNQICAGQSVLITTSGSGNTYTLMPGTINGSTFAVNPQASVVYTVVASNQSCTATQQLPITVNALPQLTVSSSAAEICVGESAVITVAGANSYSWTSGPNTAQYQVSPATTTTYQVSGSSSDGCNNTTTFIQRVSECTGIEKTASVSAIRFYPNPGNGHIEVDVNSVPKTARIEVRNYLGQVVLTSSISEHIDISAFEKGVYVVSVLDNSTTLYHVMYVLQ